MPFQFWAVSALVGCEHLDTAVGRYRAAERGGRGREPVQGWAVPNRSNPTLAEKRGWEPVWLSGCSESLKFNTRSKDALLYAIAMRASGQCTRALSNKNTLFWRKVRHAHLLTAAKTRANWMIVCRQKYISPLFRPQRRKRIL